MCYNKEEMICLCIAVSIHKSFMRWIFNGQFHKKDVFWGLSLKHYKIQELWSSSKCNFLLHCCYISCSFPVGNLKLVIQYN